MTYIMISCSFLTTKASQPWKQDGFTFRTVFPQTYWTWTATKIYKLPQFQATRPQIWFMEVGYLFWKTCYLILVPSKRTYSTILEIRRAEMGRGCMHSQLATAAQNSRDAGASWFENLDSGETSHCLLKEKNPDSYEILSKCFKFSLTSHSMLLLLYYSKKDILTSA